MRSCREVGASKDPYVRFDGTGLKTDGYYCVYSGSSGTCNSDLVVLGSLKSGTTGIYRYYENVSPGDYCATLSNVLSFDGTGLKTSSVSPPGPCG